MTTANPPFVERDVPVRPLEVHPLQQPEGSMTISGGSSRPRFDHPWRKVVFFLWREGLAQTLRKVRSVRRRQMLEARARLVLILGEVSRINEPPLRVVGVGVLGDTHEQIRCPADWLIRAPEREARTLAVELNRWLHIEPRRYREWRCFSPHSGLLPCSDLKKWLRDRGEAYSETATGTVAREKSTPKTKEGGYELFLCGAGAYTDVYVLPALRRARRRVVVDLDCAIAETTAENWLFERCAGALAECERELMAAERPVVVVASYHDSHTPLAQWVQTKRPDAYIFVEKPPVTTREQLNHIERLVGLGTVAIGYNRRFAPLWQRAQQHLAMHTGPITFVATVREVAIEASHWYHWPNQGTRVTGNLCHWLDLAAGLIDSSMLELRALASGSLQEEVSIVASFADGSHVSVVASARGSALRGVQEYIEIRRGDCTLIIDDFCALRWRSGGRSGVTRSRLRDKGHAQMYSEFEAAVVAQAPVSFPAAELRRGCEMYLGAVEQIRSSERVVPMEPGSS